MKLSTEARKDLPDRTFALPGQRKFPIPDKSHAVAAKGRATQAVEAGRMSESTADKIKAKANRVLMFKRGKK